MDSIFSSKIYKTSNRKDKIKAALADPVNRPLVMQLAKYVDPQYNKKELLDPDYLADAKTKKVRDLPDVPDTSNEDTSEVKSPDNNFKPAKFSPPSKPDLSKDADEPHDDIDPIAEDTTNDIADELPVSNDEPDNAVEESQEVTTAYIAGSFLTGVCDTVLGLLNSDDSTKGASRASVKDSELWVYYSDEANLDSLMINIIESLEKANYYYLTFNRLARSHNAIIFSIAPYEAEILPKDIEE